MDEEKKQEQTHPKCELTYDENGRPVFECQSPEDRDKLTELFRKFEATIRVRSRPEKTEEENKQEGGEK